MLHCSSVQMAGSEQMLFLSGVKRLKWRPELFSQSPLNRHYRTSSPITDQFLSSTRDLSEMMLGTLLQSKISAPISSQRNEWSLRQVWGPFFLLVWGPSGLLRWGPYGLLLLVLLLAFCIRFSSQLILWPDHPSNTIANKNSIIEFEALLATFF